MEDLGDLDLSGWFRSISRRRLSVRGAINMQSMSEACASVNGLRQLSAQKYKSTDQTFDFHQPNLLKTTFRPMGSILRR